MSDQNCWRLHNSVRRPDGFAQSHVPNLVFSEVSLKQISLDSCKSTSESIVTCMTMTRLKFQWQPPVTEVLFFTMRWWVTENTKCRLSLPFFGSWQIFFDQIEALVVSFKMLSKVVYDYLCFLTRRRNVQNLLVGLFGGPNIFTLFPTEKKTKSDDRSGFNSVIKYVNRESTWHPYLTGFIVHR